MTNWASIPSSTAGRRLLMIYVHIPFCTSKCHFCDWVQPIPKSELLLKPADEPRRRYIQALVREIQTRGRDLSAAGYVPYVLYWGGGTASSLDESEAEAVMNAIATSFNVGSVAEATIECSPETISPDKLRRFRQLGFNRFSSGVQSFNPRRLQLLGRSHNAGQAREMIGWAREAGFEQLNIDLMCGFPDEPAAEVEETIAAGLALPITHLSVYAFRPTPGTLIRRRMNQEQSNAYRVSELVSFTRARALVKRSGYPEYAVGYFGEPALNVVMPFQLRLETVGFGSGAVALLDGMYHGHNKGHFAEYLADPLRWDYSSPASNPGVAMSMLRSGLSVYDGLLRQEWLDRTGVALADVIADPALAPLMEYLRTTGKLIEDARGIRLPESTAAHVIVDLAFRGSMAQMQARSAPDRRAQAGA
jgi:coproporphyrinogen III oxidase-like Fe-S oxidoreductase